MKARLMTAAVDLCVLAAVMLFFDTLVFETVVALIALIGIHEIYNAFALGKGTAHIFYAFIPYTLLVMFSNVPLVKMLLVPGTFVLGLYLACCVIRHSQTLNAAKLGGMTMYSAMLLWSLFSFVFIKHQLGNMYEAVYLILLILCFAWGGDSAAYFAGCYFGKHKLAPVVSPHKTVEGAIGGVLGSGVLGVMCTYAAIGITQLLGSYESCPLLIYLGQHSSSILVVFVIGMVCSVLGILGDLFASAVKRQCQIKDYGTIFPGHGGILDRFDSVTFIAPAMGILVWLVTKYLLNP